MKASLKRYRFFLLFLTVLVLTGCEKSKPISLETDSVLNIVVMDPLSDRLACDCVEGYAQRKYDNLGMFLEKQLSQKVWIRYGENLSEILRVNPGRVDLIIGKSSIVEYDMNKAGISAHPIAALTDQSGSTKITGFFTVRKNDKAKKIADLEDYKIMFGPQWETEKSLDAIKALKFKGVSIPKEIVRGSTCNSSALAVIEKDADAAIISSYILPLLEGCDTIDKGQLRVIGETGEVDFITVFAADSLSSDDQKEIVRALLAVKDDKELLKQMESRNGFVGTTGREVKNTLFNFPTNWPDWRGPNRDGISSDIPAKLTKEAKFLWREKLSGLGLSGIAATSKYVIVADKDKAGKMDIFRCLDADNGREIWNLTYPAPGELEYSNSPRANPVIYKDKVYLSGAFGDLHCVKLNSGKIIWKINIVKDFRAELSMWGTCSTPLIVDDKLIVNPGAKDASLVALDCQTGEVIWKCSGEPSSYSSFIVGTFGNVRQIVGYDSISVGGWDINTGKRLWKLIPPLEGDFNVPTPINVNGKLLLTSENNGTRLYEFNDDGTIAAEPIAVNMDLTPDCHTPVVLNGLVFGCAGGKLFCLDSDDGLRLRWSGRDDGFYDYLTMIAGNNQLLITTIQGQLMLIEALADQYTLNSKLTLFEDNEVWSHPALIGNRLYIRNDKEICCLLLDTQGNLIEPLRPYVSQIVAELEKVSPGRRAVLDQIVDDIVMRLKDHKDARLTFICSHNSRRSHMSQLWAQTAAYYYGLDNVYSFSGGTDVTACNIRTVSVLRRVGFSIVSTTEEDNPVYLIQFSNERPPMRAYSKLYNTDSNPEKDFIALMCCSKADRACPVVLGATSRYAIHYVDPKACDETTEEISEYNERCREIAREMFYIMSHVHERLNITSLKLARPPKTGPVSGGQAI